MCLPPRSPVTLAPAGPSRPLALLPPLPPLGSWTTRLEPDARDVWNFGAHVHQRVPQPPPPREPVEGVDEVMNDIIATHLFGAPQPTYFSRVSSPPLTLRLGRGEPAEDPPNLLGRAWQELVGFHMLASVQLTIGDEVVDSWTAPQTSVAEPHLESRVHAAEPVIVQWQQRQQRQERQQRQRPRQPQHHVRRAWPNKPQLRRQQGQRG